MTVRWQPIGTHFTSLHDSRATQAAWDMKRLTGERRDDLRCTAKVSASGSQSAMLLRMKSSRSLLDEKSPRPRLNVLTESDP